MVKVPGIACRASAAASKAQHTLQGAADLEAQQLAARIATAEAAVEQAEQAAAEAIELQATASKAARVAEKHCKDAALESNAALHVSSSLMVFCMHGLEIKCFETLLLCRLL